MNDSDPFGFALEAGQVSKSQEELLRQQPLLGGSVQSSDCDDDSPVSEERYLPSSPLRMVSLPDSQDDGSAVNIPTPDLFLTPPEVAAAGVGLCTVNRAVEGDTEMVNFDDICGVNSEGRPAVDLSKDSDLGAPEMEVLTERIGFSEICIGDFSEMDLDKEFQLNDGLRDLSDQMFRYVEEYPDSNATVNAVANSKGKEVAGAGNASPPLVTVEDGDQQLLKERINSEMENVCDGNPGDRAYIVVEECTQGVRQNVRTASEFEELKDYEAGITAPAQDDCINVPPDIVGQYDSVEAENHLILRKLPPSLKPLLENEAKTKDLGSKMKASSQNVETVELNCFNESTEEVSKRVKWIENAVASDNVDLGSLPMSLLECLEDIRKSLTSEKQGSVGNKGETVNAFDLLKRIQENADDHADTDMADNDDDEGVDGFSLLQAIKSRGVIFPRPRWWSDEYHKKSKLRDFTN